MIKADEKKINRKGAKDAKEVLNSWYLTIESLALLRDLRAFAVPRCWFRFVRLRKGDHGS